MVKDFTKRPFFHMDAMRQALARIAMQKTTASTDEPRHDEIAMGRRALLKAGAGTLLPRPTTMAAKMLW